MYSVVAHQNYSRDRRDNRQQAQQQSSHHHHHHHHQHQQGGGGGGNISVDGVGGGGAGSSGGGGGGSSRQQAQQNQNPDGRRRSQRHRNQPSITGRFLNYLKRRFNPVQGKRARSQPYYKLSDDTDWVNTDGLIWRPESNIIANNRLRLVATVAKKSHVVG